MRTLQEKYKGVLEGKFSKAQFIQEAKQQLPYVINNLTGFDDTVKILMSRNILHEWTPYGSMAFANAKEPKESTKVNLNSLEVGDLIYVPSISFDIIQVKEKEKNGKVGVGHEGEGKKVYYLDGDKQVELWRKKEDIRESKKQVLPKANYSLEALERGIDFELEKMGLDSASTPSEKDYEKAKAKAEKNLAKDCNYYINLLAGESKKVNKHDQMEPIKKSNNVDSFNGLKKAELREIVSKILAEKELTPAEQKKKEQIVKALKKSGHSKKDPSTYAIATAQAKKVTENKTFDTLVQKYVKNGASEKNAKKQAASDMNARARDAERSEYTAFNSNEAVQEGENQFASNIMQTWEDSDVIVNDIKNFVKELILRNGEEGAQAFKMLVQQAISEIPQQGNVQEGRLAKIKGGKVVKEDDYGSGGYVESMGPKLDKALAYLTKVWDEWKNGPATEAGMVPHAKKDLLAYLGTHLKEQEEVEEQGHAYTDDMENQTSNDAAWQAVFGDEDPEEAKVKEQLKESFKKMIRGILSEDKKILKEAKAENIEKYINYENEANPDLAARIRKGATELADIVARIEKNYLDSRDRIESIYQNIGPYMAPSISYAFKKDIEPILQKYRAIQLPKTATLSPEQQELAKNNPSGGVNESKKTKYTNRKK